jgi:hypothetical protein
VKRGPDAQRFLLPSRASPGITGDNCRLVRAVAEREAAAKGQTFAPSTQPEKDKNRINIQTSASKAILQPISGVRPFDIGIFL